MSKKYNLHLLLYSVLFSAISLLCVACSAPDSFRIKGKISGEADMNISLTYYANEGVHTLITIVRKGEFEAECLASSPALVAIRDGNGRPLGLIYASPGDKISCTLDRNNPFHISAHGNPLAERWAQVADSLSDQLLRASSPELNRLVEDFIANNPEDEISSLLFAQCYDASISPLRADSVLRSISPQARNAVFLDSYITLARAYADSASISPIHTIGLHAAQDTIRDFCTSHRPLNFIALSGDRVDWRHDSLRMALKRILPNPRVQILNLSLATDSFTWRRIIRQDSINSKNCIQAWAPGGTLAPQISRLAIPTLPYFIIADSTGRQLLRTTSLSEAEDFIQPKK